MRKSASLSHGIDRALALALWCSPRRRRPGRLPTAPGHPAITPMKLSVGDMLTIRGRELRLGQLPQHRHLPAPRARAVFVKADKATKTKIKSSFPRKLLPFLSADGGKRASLHPLQAPRARSALRHAFTREALSPVVGPSAGGARRATPGCDPNGIRHGRSTADRRPAADKLEVSSRPTRASADTDSDGVDDGYEYYSALDLNPGRSLRGQAALPERARPERRQRRPRQRRAQPARRVLRLGPLRRRTRAPTPATTATAPRTPAAVPARAGRQAHTSTSTATAS